jgi:hypothetical protein
MLFIRLLKPDPQGQVSERRVCRNVFLIWSTGVMEHWGIVEDPGPTGEEKALRLFVWRLGKNSVLEN